MLQNFLIENRELIIAETRKRVGDRPAPRPSEIELKHGVPLFLDQLINTLRDAMLSNAELSSTAADHGEEMRQHGFTLAQVVHDYGDICQVVTELAIEARAPITTDEFRILNRCLDEAIAEAVTAYARRKEQATKNDETERLGRLAHELRDLVNTAMFSFDIIKRGNVAVGGSTGAILTRSLNGLCALIDRSLAEVRLDAGLPASTRFRIADFIEEVELSAALEANQRGVLLTVTYADPNLQIDGDRQILASVLSNLVRNALKFTRPDTHVSIRVRATDASVLIDVEDECGGLPPGKAEALFAPFVQRGGDRSGLGLGLTICRRGVKANGGKLRVENLQGRGCVFTVELPRSRG